MTEQLDRIAAALAGRYRPRRELGRGGMATVYLADDLKHGRDVALKVLRPELAAALGPERFLQEIEIAARLHHPHIVPLYDSGDADGLLYYVMPFVEGESLRARLQREQQLPVDQALRITREVADALSYAHRCGVVHRDVKPENVLLESGHAVVADFGIARAIDVAGGTRITATGIALGTPTYMSPEQGSGDHPVDGRSDVYSLGCVLYEMLAGEPPFAGPSVASLLHQHVAAAPRPVTAIRPTVPPSVVGALERALAKVPADRFATAAQFAEQLGAGGGAMAGTPVTHRWTGWAVLVAAAVIAAIGVMLGPWSPWRGGPSPQHQIRSVAVLPFDNLTGDPAEAYFVDGIHEALIADLATVSDLRVISRTSAVRYRETTLSAPEIARELGVDGVIEGSVLKAGDSVRIQASLIDGATDDAVGTVTYVRDVQNVLGLLQDVAGGIAGQLAQVTTRNRESLAPRRPVDPIAYEAYLRARHLMHDFRTDSWREAVRLYERAIALDSSFAQARTGLAMAYFTAGFFGVEPRGQVWPTARTIAQRAIEVDEAAGEGYATLGYLALYEDWDWDEAEAMLLRALRLDPNDTSARHGYADLLAVLGRVEESFRQVQLAREVDPLSPIVNGSVLGHRFFARQFDSVLIEAPRMRDVFDRPTLGSRFVMASLWQMGRYEEALQELKLMSAGDSGMVRAVDRGSAKAGAHGAMRAAADYLASRWDTAGGDPYSIAMDYASAGAVAESLEWLEQAYRERQPNLPHIVTDPAFDVLRSSPQFQGLLRRIGLPGNPREAAAEASRQ